MTCPVFQAAEQWSMDSGAAGYSSTSVSLAVTVPFKFLLSYRPSVWMLLPLLKAGVEPSTVTAELSILPRFCPCLLHIIDSMLAQIRKPLTTARDSPCSCPRSLWRDEAWSCLLHHSKPGSPGDLLTPRSPDWKGK